MYGWIGLDLRVGWGTEYHGVLQELEEEFEDKILFGFLEGIWYLDIIYQASKYSFMGTDQELVDYHVEQINHEKLSNSNPWC